MTAFVERYAHEVGTKAAEGIVDLDIAEWRRDRSLKPAHTTPQITAAFKQAQSACGTLTQ